MDRDREPLSRVLVAGLVALALGIALTLLQGGARARSTVSAPDAVARALLAPVQNGSRAVLDGTTDFLGGLAGAGRLRRENAELRAQLARLSLYDESQRRLESEIAALRRLNRLRDLPGRRWLTADVRGYDPVGNRISVAAGSRQGVRIGCPVVSADGLLAIVRSVGANESQALLLPALLTRVGGIVAGHDPPPAGLLAGDGLGAMTLTLDDPAAAVANGDRVMTTGFGALIPRGLLIGRVIQIEDAPEIGARVAKVYPAAAVGGVREVRILL